MGFNSGFKGLKESDITKYSLSNNKYLKMFMTCEKG